MRKQFVCFGWVSIEGLLRRAQYKLMGSTSKLKCITISRILKARLRGLIEPGRYVNRRAEAT